MLSCGSGNWFSVLFVVGPLSQLGRDGTSLSSCGGSAQCCLCSEKGDCSRCIFLQFPLVGRAAEPRAARKPEESKAEVRCGPQDSNHDAPLFLLWISRVGDQSGQLRLLPVRSSRLTLGSEATPASPAPARSSNSEPRGSQDEKACPSRHGCNSTPNIFGQKDGLGPKWAEIKGKSEKPLSSPGFSETAVSPYTHKGNPP